MAGRRGRGPRARLRPAGYRNRPRREPCARIRTPRAPPRASRRRRPRAPSHTAAPAARPDAPACRSIAARRCGRYRSASARTRSIVCGAMNGMSPGMTRHGSPGHNGDPRLNRREHPSRGIGILNRDHARVLEHLDAHWPAGPDDDHGGRAPAVERRADRAADHGLAVDRGQELVGARLAETRAKTGGEDERDGGHNLIIIIETGELENWGNWGPAPCTRPCAHNSPRALHRASSGRHGAIR